jgi:hypothetical protein
MFFRCCDIYGYVQLCALYMLGLYGFTRASTLPRPYTYIQTDMHARTHTHIYCYLLLFHGNNSFVNALVLYVHCLCCIIKQTVNLP